jgi:hypothetical protein
MSRVRKRGAEGSVSGEEGNVTLEGVEYWDSSGEWEALEAQRGRLMDLVTSSPFYQ